MTTRSSLFGSCRFGLGLRVITAGKRLSKNIFVTYVSNPSSPRLDVRQIEWQVAKNLTLLLTQSGRSYAVDLQRETRF